MKFRIRKISSKKYDEVVKQILENDLKDLEYPEEKIESLVKKEYMEIIPTLEVLVAAYMAVAPQRFEKDDAVVKICNSEKFFRACFQDDVTEIEYVRTTTPKVWEDLWSGVKDYLDNTIGGTRHDNLRKELQSFLN